MLYSGTDPESCINEYTSEYEYYSMQDSSVLRHNQVDAGARPYLGLNPCPGRTENPSSYSPDWLEWLFKWRFKPFQWLCTPFA